MAHTSRARKAGGWLVVLLGVLIVSMAWRTPLVAQRAQLTEKDVLPLVTRCFLMGMDHKRLTYYFNGRNMRLTDVAGELVPQIVGKTAV